MIRAGFIFESGAGPLNPERILSGRAAAINEALTMGTAYARDLAQKNLSGRFLNVRTGALKKSVTFGPAKSSGAQQQAWVGNYPPIGSKGFNYGAAWELGFKTMRPKKQGFNKVRTPWSGKARPWLSAAAEETIPMLEKLLIKAGGYPEE